jgi:hypothetical protein
LLSASLINMKSGLILRSNFSECLSLELFGYAVHLNTHSCMKSGNDSQYALYSVLASTSFPSFSKESASIGILFLSQTVYSATRHQSSFDNLAWYIIDLILQLIVYITCLTTLFIECLYTGQGLTCIPFFFILS